MALNFKGETTTAVLNNTENVYKKDDLFRLYDAGILKLGNIVCEHGDFVSWNGTSWQLEKNAGYAVETSGAGESLEERVGAIEEAIPDDAGEENKLITENGDQMKVLAAAFNDLNARIAALESAVADNNIGSVIADSIDTQTLLVGGSDLEARVAAIEAILTNNNLRTAAAPASSFTKSESVDNLGLQPDVTETKKEIEDNIMEDK